MARSEPEGGSDYQRTFRPMEVGGNFQSKRYIGTFALEPSAHFHHLLPSPVSLPFISFALSFLPSPSHSPVNSFLVNGESRFFLPSAGFLRVPIQHNYLSSGRDNEAIRPPDQLLLWVKASKSWFCLSCIMHINTASYYWGVPTSH